MGAIKQAIVKEAEHTANQKAAVFTGVILGRTIDRGTQDAAQGDANFLQKLEANIIAYVTQLVSSIGTTIENEFIGAVNYSLGCIGVSLNPAISVDDLYDVKLENVKPGRVGDVILSNRVIGPQLGVGFGVSLPGLPSMLVGKVAVLVAPNGDYTTAQVVSILPPKTDTPEDIQSFGKSSSSNRSTTAPPTKVAK